MRCSTGRCAEGSFPNQEYFRYFYSRAKAALAGRNVPREPQLAAAGGFRRHIEFERLHRRRTFDKPMHLDGSVCKQPDGRIVARADIDHPQLVRRRRVQILVVHHEWGLVACFRIIPPLLRELKETRGAIGEMASSDVLPMIPPENASQPDRIER